MSQGAQLLGRLHSIAAKWPKDHVRPNTQFAQAILAASSRALEGRSKLSGAEEQQVEAMIASLESVLTDKAKSRFPLSEHILKPASYPDHYQKLDASLAKVKKLQDDQNAPNATSSKGWFSKFLGS